jgi:hypothetical protein
VSDAIQATIDDVAASPGDITIDLGSGVLRTSHHVWIHADDTRMVGAATIVFAGPGPAIMVSALDPEPSSRPIYDVVIAGPRIRTTWQADAGIRAIRASRLRVEGVHVSGSDDWAEHDRSQPCGIWLSGCVAPTIRDYQASRLYAGIYVDTWQPGQDVSERITGSSGYIDRAYVTRSKHGILCEESQTLVISHPVVEGCEEGIYLQDTRDVTMIGGHLEGNPLTIDGSEDTRVYGMRSRDGRPGVRLIGAKRAQIAATLPRIDAYSSEASEDCWLNGREVLNTVVPT